jgi:DNA helicase II / ATP-dependent DNA helicase PcrA
MSLNASQKKAVLHRGSPLIVLAGAGTGKTRVITHRIGTLISEGVPAHRILAVTFTNKAAREMRQRLSKMKVPDEVWIGTFHSTGLRLLKRYGNLIGYSKNFTIYDDDAQKALVKALLADVDTKGKKLSEGLVHYYISQLKGSNRGPQEVTHEESGVPQPLHRIVREVFERYEEALKRSNAMDFADLLLNTVRLLRAAKGTEAQGLLSQFKHVMVDEFQDTNAIQMEMADLLSSSGELCVVGDDDQAIYGWRGADPKGMIRFSKRPRVEVIKLEENYRCTAPILDCANALIAHNRERLGKTLRANKEGNPVRVMQLSDERAEATQVARSINAPYGEHAILYRTHVQSRPLEEALRRKGIPYTIVGGLRFYDRSEVKDVLSYFRLAVNPKSDMDLLRVANKPSRGMGPKKMGALKTAAAKSGLTSFEALKESTDEKSQELHQLLLDLATAKNTCLSLVDFFWEVMKLTRYRDSLVAKMNSSKSQDQREKAEMSLANVDELASDLAGFTQDKPQGSLEDYLDHVSLISSYDKESGPSVSLMTIHASKGLEFPYVHLVGCEENILPHQNSVKASEEDNNEAPIEEERRLAYVAITRAIDHLDITLAKTRAIAGKASWTTPSRFLRELPKDRIKKLSFS